ncbi:ribosomal protein S18 acetylase RimI-like enzyme [Parvibaculum indicum]|uniref:GNAT family N-acetyltransferase n=1 Tax=Parvibaculum indicum TaxID=562969 RepID=UPI00141F775C|nr:GNAT family N-acetyltransferase [Parvibaculum indicum]NIJ40517.1 ribosomal protein S18 acetylase RimI-like enzyme [Parvibaculum indicum]
MSDILIRNAVFPADERAAIGLLGELNDAEALIETNRADAGAAAAHFGWLRGHVERHDGEWLVAERQGRIAGFGCYIIEEANGAYIRPECRRYAMILDVSVTPDARGQGIGRQLIQEIEERARERGLGEVRLGVLGSNSNAIRLYEKLGYGDYERVMRKAL